jgi:Secretion system C-terminal sorting domain
MKNFLLFTLQILILPSIFCQTTIIEDFTLPQSQKVADFPSDETHYTLGKSNSSYWLDVPNYNEDSIFERSVNAGSGFKKVGHPVPEGFNFTFLTSQKGKMYWQGDKSTATTLSNGFENTTTWRLYSTVGGVADSTLICEKTFVSSCTIPGGTNYCKWSGSFHIVDENLIYFTAKAFTEKRRQYSTDGGQTWQICSYDFSYSDVRRFGNLFVMYFNSKFIYSSSPDFFFVTSVNYPNSIINPYSGSGKDVVLLTKEDTINVLAYNGIVYQTTDLGINWVTKQTQFSYVFDAWVSEGSFWFHDEKGIRKTATLDDVLQNIYPKQITPNTIIYPLFRVDSVGLLGYTRGIGVLYLKNSVSDWENISEDLNRTGLSNMHKIGEVLIGEGGSFQHWQSTDGSNWEILDGSQFSPGLRNSLVFGDSVAFFAHFNNTNEILRDIYKTYDGVNWTFCDTITINVIGDIFKVVEKHLWAFGSDYFVEINENCDSTSVYNFPNLTTFPQFILQRDAVILYHNYSVIRKSVNHGQTWTTITPNNVNLLDGSIFEYKNRLLFGEPNLRMWESFDYGKNWQLISEGVTSDDYFYYHIKSGFLVASTFGTQISTWYITSNPSDKWYNITNALRPSNDNFEIFQSKIFFTAIDTALHASALYSCNVQPLIDVLIPVATKDIYGNFTKLDCKISPNPTSGVVNIELENFENELKFEAINCLIVNQLGQVIRHFNLDNKKQSLDLSGISNGIYVMKFEVNGKQILVKKLIVND